jgi:hypothetical protein
VLRVVKDGFAPYEARVVISSGDRSAVSAELLVVTQVGALRVVESSGKVAEVRLDSAVVGRTPWEGRTSAGHHVIRLQGGYDVGAAPRSVEVTTGRTTEVSMAVGVLPGEMRVEPTPPSAHVVVDGRLVSTGTFSGLVPSGNHTVRVEAGWYEPHEAVVPVSSAAPQAVRILLVSVPRVALDLFGGGAVLVPLNGSRRVEDCAGGCTGPTLGLRGGYRLTRPLSLEVFLVPSMTVSGAAGSKSLVYGGASASWRFFDRTPLTLRFSAGVGYGSFWTPVAGPEVRIGYQVTRSFGVDAGVGATFGLFPQIEGGAGPGIFFPMTVGRRAGL